MKNILYVILDGLGDRAIPDFDGKTPLEMANTPNMDFLAKKGVTGQQNMLPENVYPTSEETHLVLFGYDYILDYPGRGVLEAMGSGISLGKDDIAFRINIGTVDDDFNLIDPHAGGVTTIKPFTDVLKGIEIDGVRFDIYPSLEHRGVLVIRGNGNLDTVTDTDPHKARNHDKHGKILIPESMTGSNEGEFTAKLLRKYQEKTFEILKNHELNVGRVGEGKLPCNFILTRGSGKIRNIKSFDEKYGLKSFAVAGAPLYKGIAKYLGMDLHENEKFTGKADTDVKAKVEEALNILSLASKLNSQNFIYLHIKATDTLAEDFGDYIGKRSFIEKIDFAFKAIKNLENTIIMITGDHATACEARDHVLDPVPFLIYDGANLDDTSVFGETESKNGKMGYTRGEEFFELVLSMSKE